MADDIVTELREWGGDGDGSDYDIEDAVPCSMLREAANKIERLQADSLAARHDLHAALIALNDLLADQRTQPDAQRTLRDITSRRKLNVHALRPLTRQAYGT